MLNDTKLYEIVSESLTSYIGLIEDLFMSILNRYLRINYVLISAVKLFLPNYIFFVRTSIFYFFLLFHLLYFWFFFISSFLISIILSLFNFLEERFTPFFSFGCQNLWPWDAFSHNTTPKGGTLRVSTVYTYIYHILRSITIAPQWIKTIFFDSNCFYSQKNLILHNDLLWMYLPQLLD